MSVRRALILFFAVVCWLAPVAAAAPPPSPPGGSDDLTQPADAGLPGDPSARLEELQSRIAAADIREGDLSTAIEESDKRRAHLDGVIAGFDRQIADLNVQLA